MLFLFNTTIMPNEGVFVSKKISAEDVAEIFRKNQDDPTGMINYTSAIGHQGSADAFNAIFPYLHCATNRIQATMSTGDQAIALKVLGRIAEGQILDFAALQDIGFEFYHVRMIADNIGDLEQSAVYAGAAPIAGTIWA